MSQVTQHIGNRIKLYRKAKNFTLTDLSILVNKSKSTLSKYEKGDIAIDIDTICDMAAALDVNIRQLLDMPFSCIDTPALMPRGFFSKCTVFYVYYLNKNSKRIVPGVLELTHEADGGYTSLFFADVKDYSNVYQCRHLYYGDVHHSDSFVNFVMQNQDNAAERIFLNVANTFGQGTVTVGILSGTSSKYMVPISMKAILSQQKLPQDETLYKAINFSKDDIAQMKLTHCFSVDRLFEMLND